MDTSTRFAPLWVVIWASMGPCLFRHGYATQQFYLAVPQRSFNGAMPFQAWILGTCIASVCSENGFNGAMPFQAWIWVSKKAYTAPYRTLQWGHAFSGMDICGSRRYSRRNSIASMGPCLFRHGYPLLMASGSRAVGASMGPCLFRHGYDRVGRGGRSDCKASMGPCLFRHGYWPPFGGQPKATLASMGPCLFRHGYKYCAKFNALGIVLLQWGHAFSGMDMGLRHRGAA